MTRTPALRPEGTSAPGTGVGGPPDWASAFLPWAWDDLGLTGRWEGQRGLRKVLLGHSLDLCPFPSGLRVLGPLEMG